MVNIYSSLLPRVLEVINAFAPNDESRACDLFEIIEEIIDNVITVILPHVRSVIELCLRISSNKENDVSVQIKAVSIIGWLIRSKSKVSSARRKRLAYAYNIIKCSRLFKKID